MWARLPGERRMLKNICYMTLQGNKYDLSRAIIAWKVSREARQGSKSR